MNKILLLVLLSLSFQNTTILETDLFSVNCYCELEKDYEFISLCKSQGVYTIYDAYKCLFYNDDISEYGIYNIVVHDHSKDLNGQSIDWKNRYKSTSLKTYASNLEDIGVPYDYVDFKGNLAIEYETVQNDLNTKSLHFINKDKSYLLQVGSKFSYNTHYQLLISNFNLKK